MTSLWLTMIAAGILTYVIRLSFIQLFTKMEIPPLLRRGLRLVPPAVLSALIAPDLLLPDGILDLSPTNLRLLAGLLATFVAWRTKNVVMTIAVGMAALLLLQGLAN